MKKADIEKLVDEYNAMRETATAVALTKKLAEVNEACVTLSGENHKSALEKLVAVKGRSAVILAVVEGKAVYDKIASKLEKKTGKLSLATITPELQWSAVATAYKDTHGETLAKDATFETEIYGFFGNMLARQALMQSEKDKVAVIATKSKGAVTTKPVVSDEKFDAEIKSATSKTTLMTNLERVFKALLPDDIYVKPLKRDLNHMLNAIITPNGRIQKTSREKTLYKQFFETVKTARSGKAYVIESRL